MRHRLRVTARAGGLVLWTLLCTLEVAFAKVALRPWPESAWRWRGRWMRRWGRGLCRLMGVDLRVQGAPPEEPFFLVSNHLSYLDIPVFGAVANLVFVAKSEVASWPLLGTVCKVADTIFVVRASRRDSVRVNDELAGHLDAGHSVLVFPEGTTSDGSRIQAFRAPLLQSPALRAQPVYTAVLEYETRASDPPPEEAVCWWGDAPLLPHLRGLLAVSGITARLRFSPSAVRESDRKRLAVRLHESAVRLAADRGREDESWHLARSSR